MSDRFHSARWSTLRPATTLRFLLALFLFAVPAVACSNTDGTTPGGATTGESTQTHPTQSGATPSGATQSRPDTAPPTVSIFDRVGLIGASATAGFGVRVDAVAEDGVSREIHGADLGDVFRAACLRPSLLSRYGTMFFFMDPLGTGRSEVDRVLRFKPTCVIAVDFLFWYGYGAINAEGKPLRNEDERLALLEVGLAQLDRVATTGVPVVVGDFPDMKDAVGKMLSASQMPAAETLTTLNARLAKWASTRTNVRVLHLSTLTPILDRGEPLTIRGRVWSKKGDGALLQRDRLHPTFIGAMAMLAKACELAESCAVPQGTAAPVVVACDESLCFEPTKVRERFLTQVREGRRRDGDAGTTP